MNLTKQKNSLKEKKRKMENFILGIIVTLIIGAWVTLAIVGVISVKTAILFHMEQVSMIL